MYPRKEPLGSKHKCTSHISNVYERPVQSPVAARDEQGFPSIRASLPFVSVHTEHFFPLWENFDVIWSWMLRLKVKKFFFNGWDFFFRESKFIRIKFIKCDGREQASLCMMFFTCWLWYYSFSVMYFLSQKPFRLTRKCLDRNGFSYFYFGEEL